MRWPLPKPTQSASAAHYTRRRIRDRAQRRLLFRTADGVLPLAALSDGYQNVAAWVGDVLYRLTETFHDRRRPLDTRGLQEGSAPAEEDGAKTALESIALELRAKAPDVVVFVAKASEVDGAIDADLRALERIYDDCRSTAIR